MQVDAAPGFCFCCVMVKLDIEKGGLTEAVRKAGTAGTRAATIALNRATVKARGRVIKAMKDFIHNPTPYTLRSLWITFAKDSKQETTIEIIGSDRAKAGTPPARYLEPLLFGTKQKRSGATAVMYHAGIIGPEEEAVPLPAQRDRYGNFKIRGKALQNIAKAIVEQKAAKRTKKGQRSGVSFFKTRKVIYRREKDSSLTPLLVIAKRKRVKKAFDFAEVVSDGFDRELFEEYKNALAQYFKGQVR